MAAENKIGDAIIASALKIRASSATTALKGYFSGGGNA
jgi:hypothetical protein